MRAVVTGGAGFIGSTLTDRLLDAGHQVLVVDDLSTGRAENLADAQRRHGERCELRVLDIRDPATTEVVGDAGPEVVFHLAAQIDVRVSVEDPVRDAEVNVVGLLRVLEGARRGGARKVVFASSGGTIYGEPDPGALPVDESHPQRPLSPYGVAKKVGADYLAAYAGLHGLDWVALALANVYGPRQDPHGEAGVVAIFAGRLLSGQPCTVYGSGDQTRDYVYVDDVVAAFVAAADRGHGLLNVGTGVETSVNDLYRTMAAATGGPPEPVRAAARLGELDRIALAAGRAGDALGWRPETDLRSGIDRTLAWFRSADRPTTAT